MTKTQTSRRGFLTGLAASALTGCAGLKGGAETVRIAHLGDPQLGFCLPKDVVICDWHYGKSDLQESEPKSQPTLDHFKASGLDVLTCPWDDPVATMAQGRYAAKIGLFGVMGTLWNHYRGRAFAETVMAQACAAWGADEAPRRGYYGTLSFCNHWRQIGWDMKSGDYRNTGITDDQTTRSILAE